MLRIFGIFILCIVHSFGSTLYVDCESGSDATGTGTQNAPFRSLNRARDAIRLMQPITTDVFVSVAPGICYGSGSVPDTVNYSMPILVLSPEDSGTANARITYSSVKPLATTLSGGLPVNATLWMSMTSPNLYQLDLAAAGVKAYGYGELQSGGLGQCTSHQMELFCDSAPQLLARYPNIAPNGTWQYMHIESVTSSLSFTVADSRPLRWTNETNPWLHGFWMYDWADNYVHIVDVKPSANGAEIFVDAKTPPLYGLTKGAKFYAVNLMSEIDVPTEYAFDASTDILHYIPPATSPGDCSLSISDNIIQATGGNVAYLTLSGFAVSYSRYSAVGLTGSNLTLTSMNVSNHGGNAIDISGSNNVVANSQSMAVGCTAIATSGGDFATLQPGFNVIQNNVVTGFARLCRTYQPAIHWSDVGSAYIGNAISNAPHVGILGSGNNNLFANNILSDLCYEVSDSGAWYSGRSWVARGNSLINNTFLRIQNKEGYTLGSPSVQAIYFDDELSQQVVINNTFINCTKGVFIGGGRDHIVEHNVCKNVGYCVHIDDRGLNWQHDACSNNGLLIQQLYQYHYQSPPYSTAYPQLPFILESAYHPCTPFNNTVAHNTYCTGPLFQGFIDVPENETLSWYDVVTDNTQVSCESL